MGIRIDGNNDLIKAVDDTLTIEGISVNTVGLMTATGGVKVGTAATIHSTGQFNIGVAHTLFANGNATHSGIVTASSFVGSGANLTGITQTTINSNADNRIITGSGSANTLNGESNLTFDGSNTLAITGPEGGAARMDLICDEGDDAADKVRLVHTSGNEFKIQRTTSHTDSLAIDASGNSQFAGQVKVSSSNASTVAFSVGDTNTGFYNAGSNIFGYSISGTEKLRIDTAGRVQIGHNSSVVGGKIEVHATSAETQITINESSDSGGGPALYLNRTRGSDLSSPTPIQDGNYMGSIHFGSYDTNSYEKGASIEARADGQTWADGDCPTRLSFLTTPDDSTTPTERVRIDKNGQLVLSNGNLSTAYGNSITGGTNLELDTQGIIKFRTDTNQKASITDNGLCFGTDSAAANALDDYEEGSWTPTVHDGTISTGVCKYTKVGRLVTVVAKVSNFSNNSANDSVRIQSLPFTPAVVDCMAGTLMGSYLGQTNSSALYLSDTNQLIAYGQHSGAFDNLRHNELSVSSGSTVLYIVATYMAS